MPGHTTKMIVSIWRNSWHLSAGKKKSTSSFMFSLRYYKNIKNLLFGYSGHVWLPTLKVILSTCRKLLCWSAGKKNNFIFHVFLDTLQKYTSLLFWALCACLVNKPKMIVSTCRRLQCLSVCQKYSSSLTSLLRYYILKNPASWLADCILA